MDGTASAAIAFNIKLEVGFEELSLRSSSIFVTRETIFQKRAIPLRESNYVANVVQKFLCSVFVSVFSEDTFPRARSEFAPNARGSQEPLVHLSWSLVLRKRRLYLVGSQLVQKFLDLQPNAMAQHFLHPWHR